MAEEFDTVTIPELDNLALALNSYFATSNLNGKLGKATVQELVTFIAPYVQGVASSGFVATTGTVLPTPTAGKFTFVSTGTFTQTTGGSITTTQLLNLLIANGTSWSLSLAIPIVLPAAKTPLWTAQAYTINSQVLYLGKQWSNTSATTSTEIPGTSAKWVDDLNGKADRSEGFAAWGALSYLAGRKVTYAGKIWFANTATTATDVPSESNKWTEELYAYKSKTDTSKLDVWSAKSYAIGSQVVYLGKIWESNAATTATDIPGTSALWFEELYAYRDKDAALELQLNGGNFIFGAADDISTYSTLSVSNTYYSRAYLGTNGQPADGYLEQIDFYVARAGVVYVRIMEPTGVLNEYVSKYTMAFPDMPIGVASKVVGVDFAKNMKIAKGSIALTLAYPSSTVGAIGSKTKTSSIMAINVESGRDVGTKYSLNPFSISTELGLRLTLRSVSKIDQVNNTIKDLNTKLYGTDPTYSFGTTADLNTGFEGPIADRATQAYLGESGFPSDSYMRSIEVFVATAGRVLFRLAKPTPGTNPNSFTSQYLFSKTLPVGYAILTEGVDFPKNTKVYKGGVLATYSETGVYGTIGQRSYPALNLYSGASRLQTVDTTATIYKNTSTVEIGMRVNLETINTIGDLTKNVGKLTALPVIKSNYIRLATANNRRNSGINIFKTKEGNVGALYTETFGGDGNDFNESKIGVCHSIDGGKTFSPPVFKPKPGFAESNTNIFRKENGDLILFYSATAVQNGQRFLTISYSYDSGLTWTNGFNTGIQLTLGNGTLRASDGNIYLPIYGGTTGGKLLVSKDNGATFTDVGFTLKDDVDPNIVNSNSLTEPGVYEISAGKFVFYFRSLERGYCRAFISNDYGLTWGSPFNLFKAPDSMSSIRKISWLNANLTEASVYLAVHNRLTAATSQGNAEDRKYMILSVSRDGITYVTTDVYVYNYDGNTINSRSFEPNIYDDGTAIRIGWSTFRNTGTNPLESALMGSLSYNDLQKVVDFYIPI